MKESTFQRSHVHMIALFQHATGGSVRTPCMRLLILLHPLDGLYLLERPQRLDGR